MFSRKKKEPTITELEQLSDFYMMDLYDMMDDDFKNIIIPIEPKHGLLHTEVTKQDFESIAQFGRIVKNYQKLKRLADENIPD
jgi:hypothetical protein